MNNHNSGTAGCVAILRKTAVLRTATVYQGKHWCGNRFLQQILLDSATDDGTQPGQ